MKVSVIGRYPDCADITPHGSHAERQISRMLVERLSLNRPHNYTT